MELRTPLCILGSLWSCVPRYVYWVVCGVAYPAAYTGEFAELRTPLCILGSLLSCVTRYVYWGVCGVAYPAMYTGEFVELRTPLCIPGSLWSCVPRHLTGILVVPPTNVYGSVKETCLIVQKLEEISYEHTVTICTCRQCRQF